MSSRGTRFVERLDALWLAATVAVGFLGVRLLHMQVVRNAYYAEVAERQRTQIIAQAAPRGRVYDRNGDIVATNQPAFSLIFLPGKSQDPARLAGLSESLARELHRDRDELLDKLREAVREESAIHLAENLPLKTMFKLSELKTLYPGVDLIVEARRFYPNGAFAGHLLGYMGKIDRRAWRLLRNKGYRVDSWVGKAGVESRYEDILRGVDGEIRMEVDAQGRLRRRLGEVPWQVGGNIHLTIDSRIQKAVEEGLRASPSGQGAVVVMDPRSGEVLALASAPDFDPNLLLLPDWDEGRKGAATLPEFNRALQGTYAPGSVFKVIMDGALLQEGTVGIADRVFCPGYHTVGNRTFKCWEKKGHKSVDFMDALAYSCDVYFYTMGLRLKGPVIERYEHLFGLGRKTGIDFPGERSGNIFGPEARKTRKRGWYEGDTANLSIGQGELLTTPIQMAVVAAAVANKGTLWKPRYVKRLERRAAKPEEHASAVAGRVELRDDVWQRIREAMVHVVKRGTGQRVNVPGLVVGGKTGTSQNPLGEDHAWFIAYAGRPDEEPSLALAVLIQHGGHGSSAAGPVARKAIEAAFDLASAKPAGVPAEGSLIDEVPPERDIERAAPLPVKPPAPPPAAPPAPPAPKRVVTPRPSHSAPSHAEDGDIYSEGD
ncbi:MAG: penicillin-binding protein 2 [Elusimicrobia bacterium]|nr:penicillin-binding protein 2 [Elusimicrobiota bacterium]